LADATSTIRVNIVGDTKGLQKELTNADKGITGLTANAGKLVGALALGAAAAGVGEFAQTALDEADRLGDATARLELQLGDLSAELIEAAGNFSELGLSTQDVLELEAAFADAGRAMGLTSEAITEFADEAAATAGAIALITDMDADKVIDLIGKAAGGSIRALRDLGISLTDAEVEARALADTGKDTADALTDSELAAAAYALVLEKLEPRLAAVAEGSGDVEQKQAELQAKWETLTGKIGQGLEGPLTDLLAWMISGIEGWEMLADLIAENEQALRDFLGPAAATAELLATIARFLGNPAQFGSDLFNSLPSGSGGGSGGGGNGIGGSLQPNVTLNVVPKDSADTERAVIEALKDYEARNGSRAL
jgi:hypothetical protein